MDNNEQSAVVMSRAEAVSQLDELMVYFKQQVETPLANLLVLKRMLGCVACKLYSKLTQQKLMSYFKK